MSRRRSSLGTTNNVDPDGPMGALRRYPLHQLVHPHHYITNVFLSTTAASASAAGTSSSSFSSPTADGDVCTASRTITSSTRMCWVVDVLHRLGVVIDNNNNNNNLAATFERTEMPKAGLSLLMAVSLYLDPADVRALHLVSRRFNANLTTAPFLRAKIKQNSTTTSMTVSYPDLRDRLHRLLTLPHKKRIGLSCETAVGTGTQVVTMFGVVYPLKHLADVVAVAETVQSNDGTMLSRLFPRDADELCVFLSEAAGWTTSTKREDVYSMMAATSKPFSPDWQHAECVRYLSPLVCEEEVTILDVLPVEQPSVQLALMHGCDVNVLYERMQAGGLDAFLGCE